jgi:3-oxoacyl-[acyl-carrier protein] reductase
MTTTPATLPGITLSLAGRTALITGGSRGIGAATVRLFRQAGARVAFSYLSASGAANVLAAETGAIALQQPLATAEDGHALVAAAIQALGRLDILVVNHGIWPAHDAPIDSMPVAQWRTTLGINLDSVFGLVQATTAQMLTQPLTQPPPPGAPSLDSETWVSSGEPSGDPRDQPNKTSSRVHAEPTTPRGHIVLVSSTAAQRGEAFHADYAASKGALISLTKSLSSELAPQGIYANCVAPGWVATDMSAAALADPTIAARIHATIPLGRVAYPDEIAGPILFLCTPYAGFCSGEILNANGGAVLIG